MGTGGWLLVVWLSSALSAALGFFLAASFGLQGREA